MNLIDYGVWIYYNAAYGMAVHCLFDEFVENFHKSKLLISGSTGVLGIYYDGVLNRDYDVYMQDGQIYLRAFLKKSNHNIFYKSEQEEVFADIKHFYVFLEKEINDMRTANLIVINTKT